MADARFVRDKEDYNPIHWLIGLGLGVGFIGSVHSDPEPYW